MVKMMEPTLQIKCRKDDVSDLQGCVGELESTFKSFMQEQTGRDEFECKLVVLDDNFLTEE